VDMHLHTPTEHNHFLGIDYSLMNSNKKLPSLRFSQKMTVALKQGYIGRCVLSREHLSTLDRSNYTHSLTSCYSLLSADCTDDPHYAIFAKKENNKITLKALLGGDELIVAPKESGTEFDVTINGEDVSASLKEGVAFPKDDPEFPIIKLIQRGPFIEIFSKPLSLIIRQSAFTTLIFVPTQFREGHCGMCGNFNKNPFDDMIGPHQCVLDPKELTRAYTLHDDTCKEDVPKHTKPADCVHSHH